ncbi:MAG: hypothetical protein WBX00_24145 [Isosphaeraceae bacterium]
MLARENEPLIGSDGAFPDQDSPMPASCMPDDAPRDRAGIFIRNRHTAYWRAARTYSVLYYSSRVISGLCAALLPFFVSKSPPVATVMSVTIAVITVLDMVFDFGRKMQVYSRASNQLVIARLKRTGEYEKYADLLTLLSGAEDQLVDNAMSIDQLVKRLRDPPLPL